MICNTSAVAVCCSKASRVSVIRRAFSIAMTAWEAKFSRIAICCSVKGRTSNRLHEIRPRRAPSLRKRQKQIGAYPPRSATARAVGSSICIRSGWSTSRTPARSGANTTACGNSTRPAEQSRRGLLDNRVPWWRQERFAVEKKQGSTIRAAQCMRLFQNRIKNGKARPAMELMTCKISAVALCCWRASFSSVVCPRSRSRNSAISRRRSASSSYRVAVILYSAVDRQSNIRTAIETDPARRHVTANRPAGNIWPADASRSQLAHGKPPGAGEKLPLRGRC